MNLSDIRKMLEDGTGPFADASRYSFPYRGMLAGYISSEIKKRGDCPASEALTRTPKISTATKVAVRAALGIPTPPRASKSETPEHRRSLMERASKALAALSPEEKRAVWLMATGASKAA